MRFKKCIYLIVTGIVLSSLLVGGLAASLKSGTDEGWQFARYSKGWGPLVPVCYIVAAAGVIALSYSLLKIAGSIMSMASQLKQNQTPYIKQTKIPFISDLGKAINQFIATYANFLDNLEKNVKDLQIKLKLSQRKEKHTQAIIYSIHDAVIVIDEYENLLMANDEAGLLFGFDIRNCQHKPIRELIDPSKKDFADFICRVKNSKARDAKREINFEVNGQMKTYSCIVSTVHDENDRLCGAVAVLHDISREKQIQQAKTDFVSHVSHELKTPLASISAYSEMLADGDARDEKTVKEFCSVIQNQAQRLNRLIEDILNISRIESGLVKIDKKPVSLTILIEEQLKMIKSYADDKNIQISAPKPIVFDRVYADKDMISQVIVNLLSNAVKYTPAGGSVKIHTEVDENANLARLSVTDTGVGIPEDEIERIFDRFYRVTANNKQAEGTGLGLTLVKQIIEKVHDGKVFVKSKVGAGSTFGFVLPLATAETVNV